MGHDGPLEGTPFEYQLPSKNTLIVRRPDTQTTYYVKTNPRLDFNRYLISALKNRGERVFSRLLKIGSRTWRNSVRYTANRDPTVDMWEP